MDESELLLGARRRAGLSQRELARRAGTSQAMVARIERARQSPSAATLRRLIAVSVTEARGIVGASGDALKPPPPGAGASAVVTALVRVDGRLVVVLDPDVLCDTGRARRDTGAHPA